MGVVGPIAGFHPAWGALSGRGSYTGFIDVNNYSAPHLGARPVHVALRQLAGTSVVSTYLLSPALRVCVPAHLQRCPGEIRHERRHSRRSIRLRGTQPPHPCPHVAPRLHHQTLPTRLSRFCCSVVLRLMCVKLSHDFRMNDTQRFSCVFLAFEFPLFELVYLYLLHLFTTFFLFLVDLPALFAYS